MTYFNHIVCIALEHLSARDHLYNLSSLIGFSFVFQERTHHGAFTWGSPTLPSQYCWCVGWCPSRMAGWCENHAQFAAMQTPPLIPFFFYSLSGLNPQIRESAETTAKSSHAACLERNIPFWYLYLHMNLGTIQSQIKGRKLKHLWKRAKRNICTKSRFDHFLSIQLTKHSIL